MYPLIDAISNQVGVLMTLINGLAFLSFSRSNGAAALPCTAALALQPPPPPQQILEVDPGDVGCQVNRIEPEERRLGSTRKTPIGHPARADASPMTLTG